MGSRHGRDTGVTGRLLRAGTGLARAVGASIHFVEHLDLLASDDPANPWPPGFAGLEDLVAALDEWLDALADPT
jgi:hypothetical protein